MNSSTHRSRRSRPLVTLGVAAVMALPLVGATAGTADADVKIRVKAPKVRVSAPNVRVRVRAGARAHGHVTPRVRVRSHRTYVTPRVRTRLHIGGHVSVGGSVYVGRTYATPPPPPPAYDCDVPAYYYDQPRPVRPVVVEPAPVVRPMGPRLGIGVFAGGVKTEHTEADDVGLMARYRLTHGLAIEGELSRTDSDYGETRRAGGALIWDLASHRALSPHLLAGMGGWDGNAYAELGAGLTWRMTDNLHLAFDLRAGAVDADNRTAVGGAIAACGGCTSTQEIEHEPVSYSRGRLSAILWF